MFYEGEVGNENRSVSLICQSERAKSCGFMKVALLFSKIRVLCTRWSGLIRGELIFIRYVPTTWITFGLVKYYM